jgi:hypothetical protein
MPKRKRDSKGHFVKRGHAATTHKAMTHRRRSSPQTVTVIRQTRTGAPAKATHKRRRRSHAGGGGGMKLTHLAIAGAGLAYLTSASSPLQFIPQNVAKIPGAKTFGNAATAGLVCLGIDRFVKKNRWLRAAGVIGVVLGAVQLGTKGKDFKWVGDADGYSGDVEGDDDELGDQE